MAPAEHAHSPTPEEIMEYLDGEGSAAARLEVAAHLASCAICQAHAAEERRSLLGAGCLAQRACPGVAQDSSDWPEQAALARLWRLVTAAGVGPRIGVGGGDFSRTPGHVVVSQGSEGVDSARRDGSGVSRSTARTLRGIRRRAPAGRATTHHGTVGR